MIENRNLAVGTRLVASYKKQLYVCTVEAAEEDGAVVYVLEDGSRHKSPSAAGSKVMGGKAVNGWRFWTVEGEAPAASADAGTEKPAKTKSRSKSKKAKEKVVFKTPQVNMPAGKVH